MDFVNKAYAQLSELFRSMTPGTRIAAALLLGVIVVSLVYLFQYQGSSGDEYLLDGRPFSGSELTAIESAFAQKGLAKSHVEGNKIRIPRGQKSFPSMGSIYFGRYVDFNGDLQAQGSGKRCNSRKGFRILSRAN